MSSAARVTKPSKGAAPPPAIPPFPIRRYSVDEYHKMIETGVLTESHRVELLHGWLAPKMTVNPPHNYAVTALMERLVALRARAVIRVQQPMTTLDSEPEPDVVFAIGTNAAYKTRNPRPAECIIVVEVADTTLHEDRTTKLELYAGAGVSVYWIVNLLDRRVEVYTEPKCGKKSMYKKRKDFSPRESVPLLVRGKELGRIPVKELLP